jgi:hypothetical protein
VAAQGSANPLSRLQSEESRLVLFVCLFFSEYTDGGFVCLFVCLFVTVEVRWLLSFSHVFVLTADPSKAGFLVLQLTIKLRWARFAFRVFVLMCYVFLHVIFFYFFALFLTLCLYIPRFNSHPRNSASKEMERGVRPCGAKGCEFRRRARPPDVRERPEKVISGTINFECRKQIG